MNSSNNPVYFIVNNAPSFTNNVCDIVKPIPFAPNNYVLHLPVSFKLQNVAPCVNIKLEKDEGGNNQMPTSECVEQLQAVYLEEISVSEASSSKVPDVQDIKSDIIKVEPIESVEPNLKISDVFSITNTHCNGIVPIQTNGGRLYPVQKLVSILKTPQDRQYQKKVLPKLNEEPDEMTEELNELKKKFVNNKCLICGFISKSPKTSRKSWKHMLVHLSVRKYKCEDCDQTFVNEERLLNHQLVHTDVRAFTCDICKKDFRRRSEWSWHCKSHHSNVEMEKIKCPVCGKSFSIKGQLKRHLRTHTGEKPFFCDECRHGFTKKDDYEAHMNRHQGSKPHTCEECGKSFYSRSYLKHHMKIHNEGDKFECKICNMKFNFSSNLKQHEKTHSEDRCHKCTRCNKTFKRSHHLKQHLATHYDDEDEEEDEVENFEICKVEDDSS